MHQFHIHLRVSSVVVCLLLLLAVPAQALELSDSARTELETLFGRDACFSLYDETENTWTRINPERCAQRITPCSTFKIPHALVALTTGVVPREGLALDWDPQRDPAGEGWPEVWKERHCLTSAIKHSVVWYFQELARRIGPEREQTWLDAMGYGNRDISGGLEVFWLSSSLKISADEQVEFLRRFFRNELPFDVAHMEQVRGMILREHGTDRLFWGKTGMGDAPDGVGVGLFTGCVEKNGRRYFFALNCEVPDGTQTFVRRAKLLELSLAALGLDE
ncbi:MAG: penicillin-binding transpeptidase domain-containing protein [Desulfovibrionaceae bacterium]